MRGERKVELLEICEDGRVVGSGGFRQMGLEGGLRVNGSVVK